MRAWSDWVVYPPEFLLALQNTFLGLNERVFTVLYSSDLLDQFRTNTVHAQ